MQADEHRSSDVVPEERRRRCSTDASDHSSDNDLPRPKAAKHTRDQQVTSGRRTQLKAGDFQELEESTILLACHYYRVILTSQGAFPTERDQERFARQAWQLACQEYEVKLAGEPAIYRLVCTSTNLACALIAWILVDLPPREPATW